MLRQESISRKLSRLAIMEHATMGETEQRPPFASKEDQLGEWNRLATEWGQLWARCWNGKTRARMTLRIPGIGWARDARRSTRSSASPISADGLLPLSPRGVL